MTGWIADFVDKCGLLFYPLLLLLLGAIYIIVERSMALQRARVISPGVIEKIERLLLDRKIPEATAYCKQHPLPMTRVLLSGILNHQKQEAELKEVLEEAGRQEIPVIRRHLTALGTIASAAPLVGLIGTVFGMISVFATLAKTTSINPTMLAGGISEALYTTAFGMVIAVPALVFYNYFTATAQNLIIEMERISLRLVAVLRRT